MAPATGEVPLGVPGCNVPHSEVILARIARDRKLRRVLEDVSDLLVVEEERAKPSRPLREYMAERERKERRKAAAVR